MGSGASKLFQKVGKMSVFVIGSSGKYCGLRRKISKVHVPFKFRLDMKM
jgi:hypothetical protein